MVDTEERAGGLKVTPHTVRQKYPQVLEHLEPVDGSLMPALQAKVEPAPHTDDGDQQRWCGLLSQALAHWHAGEAASAYACALDALQSAEDVGESFGVGCAACQLASMALKQDDYQAAAAYLTQAQLALETAGRAPPGGALAAAAQLCAEIMHWQASYRLGDVARATAQTAIAQAHRDLLARLRQASDFVRASWADRQLTADDDFFDCLPTLSTPAAPSPPAALTSLRARLARWWHALYAADPPAAGSVPGSPESILMPLELGDRTAAAGSETLPQATSGVAAPVSDASEGRESAPSVGPTSEPKAAPPHHPGLAVYCFGNFRVYIDDIPIDRWDSARGRTIFKYLVARRDTPVPKELLADLFWAESEPELARRSLHQAIYCLRQTFKHLAPDLQIVQFVDDHYLINPQLAVWIDTEAFKQVVEQARALEDAGEIDQALRRYTTAVDLYGGEFLAEERYEAWAEEPRCAFQAMYLGSLHRLAHSYHQRGDHSAAIMVCQRALAQEGCDEESHRLLLACYGAQGLRHLAVRQYQLYVHTLQTELGLPPSAQMVAFYQRVVGAASESRNT